MTELENRFKGEAAQIQCVDVDSPLTSAKIRACEYYFDPYKDAAKAATEQGKLAEAAVYEFLTTLVSFHPSFDTPAQPFVPMWQIEGKRSLVPSDLSAADIEVVRALAEKSADASLRARLFDVVWETTKDHLAGMEAAKSYEQAAIKLGEAGEWTYSGDCFKRALYLASRFGRNKDLFRTIETTVIDRTRRAASSTDTFDCGKLLKVMLEFRIGEPNEFASISKSIALDGQNNNNIRKAKHYWEVAAEWFELANDAEAAKDAKLAAAEILVVEAESHTQGASVSFLTGSNLLARAIEALRQAGAPRSRIEELRERLRDWNQRSLSEFKTLSFEQDISGAVTKARDHVKGCDFELSVRRLVFGANLLKPDNVKQEVLEIASAHPLGHIFDTSIVDSDGRTTVRKQGLLNLKGDEREKALEAEAFAIASSSHWPVRISAFVEPARLQILNEHHPKFDDLYFLVRDNPFIPPGHEGIYLRGLHAGFHGDFIVSSHLLTPQIENSLRYVLESNDVDVSNLMSDGTQPVKILGTILGLPETTKIFGPSLCFELRGSLIEKTGFDFRNHVAHGFVTEDECFSAAALLVWWLVLRICAIPVFYTPPTEQPVVSPDSDLPKA